MSPRTTFVATTIALASFIPRPAMAGPSPTEPTPLALEIDVSALPEDRIARELEVFVRQAQSSVLERAGFEIDDDAPSTLRLEISRYGEDDIHYRGRLLVVGSGDEARELTCEACTESEMTRLIEIETALMVRQLDDDPVTLVPIPAPTEPHAPLPIEPTDAASRRRLGPLGIAGIGALGLGAGLITGGATRFTPDVVLRGQPGTLELRDTRAVGLGLLVGGGVALAAGASLLAVDLVRRRPSPFAFVPHASPRHVGISTIVRF